MAKTRHIQQRMSQRGIKEAMINLTLEFGKTQGERVIFNKKGIDALLFELEQMKKNILKIREKGGLVVVNVNGELLTTYSLDSYKRNYH